MQQVKQWVQQWMERRRIRRVTYDYARERVQRGAAFLDQADPDWVRHVDAHTLELSSGRRCVLGQLHGDFRWGLSRSHLINLSSAPRASLSPVSYGFRCVQNVPDAVQERDYAYLTRAWKAAVQQRRAAHSAPPPAKTVTAKTVAAEPKAGDRPPHSAERSSAPPVPSASA